ncbi:helix-turn-helix transcriptional regulator [Veillonella criceti]|uniref:Helix-turn-helix n=1 Tax=Veillonella criceti TaxID=103891 RepID=A0A380NJZ8_9FIRM|nr:helix-turn-helix transcriptional regulator [Veillonella criceti]SUP42811.1 Helix-turn-helix [Veillonella criceti]
MDTRFSDNLKYIRDLYNLKQGDFAKVLGITKAQVSAYEREISKPNLDLVLNIASKLNCSIEQLTELPLSTLFYTEWVLKGTPHTLQYIFSEKNIEEFEALAGLVIISFNQVMNTGVIPEVPEVATNFLLLNSKYGGIISHHFEKIFNKIPVLNKNDILGRQEQPGDLTLVLEGYPLLVELYQQLNHASWLGQAKSWPTTGKNILALKLDNDRIIRLYISPLAYGCKLYACYDPFLESQIKIWLSLDINERQSISQQYYLNFYESLNEHKQQVELEIKKQREHLKKLLSE